jgi:GntR family transcriptional regulator, transcriptional repressor for pyruvate dehydrogenase complex
LTFSYGKSIIIFTSVGFTPTDLHIIIPYHVGIKESTINIEKIESSDKIGTIIRAIRNYIIDGHLEPGAELPPERLFSEQLGVSRFSLREALRAAQVLGLIEIRQGKRPRVTESTTKAAADIISLTLKREKRTLLDLTEVRMAIETEVVKKAAEKATREEILQLEATIEEIRQNPNDHVLCVGEDMKFHDLLVKISNNPIFEIMISPLTELLQESRMMTIKSGVDHIIKGHEQILEAIKKKDQEKASRAMRDHLKLAEHDILEE